MQQAWSRHSEPMSPMYPEEYDREYDPNLRSLLGLPVEGYVFADDERKGNEKLTLFLSCLHALTVLTIFNYYLFDYQILNHAS